MKAERLEIFDHDTDVDVAHKNNTLELAHWINHLKKVKNELYALANLCTADADINATSVDVLDCLQKMQEDNDNLLNALHRYSASRAHIRECEDTECDMVYIAEHDTYTKSFEYHTDEFKRLKDTYFNADKGKFSLIKNQN